MRRILLSLAVLAAVAGAACGDPPDKEMQQAQGAIDAARAAGADQYAREEFTAAEDALKRSHEPSPSATTARRSTPRSTPASAPRPPPRKRSTESHRPRRRDPRRSPTPTRRCTSARAEAEGGRSARRLPARTLAAGRKAIDTGESARARSAHSVRQGGLSRGDRDRAQGSGPIRAGDARSRGGGQRRRPPAALISAKNLLGEFRGEYAESSEATRRRRGPRPSRSGRRCRRATRRAARRPGAMTVASPCRAAERRRRNQRRAGAGARGGRRADAPLPDQDPHRVRATRPARTRRSMRAGKHLVMLERRPEPVEARLVRQRAEHDALRVAEVHDHELHAIRRPRSPSPDARSAGSPIAARNVCREPSRPVRTSCLTPPSV